MNPVLKSARKKFRKDSYSAVGQQEERSSNVKPADNANKTNQRQHCVYIHSSL